MSTHLQKKQVQKRLTLVFDPLFLTFPNSRKLQQISHGQAWGRKEVGRLWYPRHGRFLYGWMGISKRLETIGWNMHPEWRCFSIVNLFMCFFILKMCGFPAMFLYRNKYQMAGNVIHIMLEFAMDWYVSSQQSCFVSSVLLTIAYGRAEVELVRIHHQRGCRILWGHKKGGSSEPKSAEVELHSRKN